MGYRSEVVIIIKDEHLNKIPEIYEYEPEISKSEGWTLFRWLWIKWYKYPFVEAVESVLNKLPDEDYYFARVGEEFGDYDSTGSAIEEIDCPFYADMETKISIGLNKVPVWQQELDKLIDSAKKDTENGNDEKWEYLIKILSEYTEKELKESTDLILKSI